jgi:hypothetical protein
MDDGQKYLFQRRAPMFDDSVESVVDRNADTPHIDQIRKSLGHLVAPPLNAERAIASAATKRHRLAPRSPASIYNFRPYTILVNGGALVRRRHPIAKSSKI